MSLPEITLDELSRLVRLLGMLGSASEGEALNAARFAAKWVREHDTSWEVLLTPEPEPGVLSVATVPDEDAQAAAIQTLTEDAYRRGYKAGLDTMAAQVKAQAAYIPPTSRWAQSFATMAAQGPASPLGGFGAPAGGSAGSAAQGPVRAPAAVPAGGWPAGSWQAVAQELLDQHAAVPGVLRSREEIFVADILRRGFATLTPAQEHWLRDIAGRNHMSW